MRLAMWINTTGGDKGRGSRKKRTKFEMRDESRVPKHTFCPLGTKKGMANREVGGKWLKAKSDGPVNDFDKVYLDEARRGKKQEGR
jgi:hypothetical protein